ncbi:hypothetical protein FS749_016802 [Ceratobasidium sp. UAMH 11750]|nr:hypothetical protein FS749_016802 [Ceratobasidium sp. UAMH 11750]
MPTPTRKAPDDGSPGARKRPRLSDEQVEDVAQTDSFSDGFFGSEIDFDDEALQMVDEYDVFQPEPDVDVTCVANSGDDPFIDGATRDGEDEDEVPSSQGEADSGEPYTIGKIHGEHTTSSQTSIRNTSPSRQPSVPSNRQLGALPTFGGGLEKEEDIDFSAYVPMPDAGFPSTAAVPSDSSMPVFMPASQVPIDRSELASSGTRSKSAVKSSIKLAGGGGALKPISLEDIKASAEKLTNYQRDTRWKPQARLRAMPPPVTPARLPVTPAPALVEDDEKETDIDFGALVKPAVGFPSTSVNMSYDDSMPTFMPASQVPIDRSELASSSTSSKTFKKLDIQLAGGSGGLVPLTEEQIKASADKLMAYQRDTTWKPQPRAKAAPHIASSSKVVLEAQAGDSSISPLDETEVNDSGVGLLEPITDAPDSKSKGKRRASTPPARPIAHPSSPSRSILRSMENLNGPRPESLHSAPRPTDAMVGAGSRPAAPLVHSRDSENPFSAGAQLNGTPIHRSVAPFKTPIRPTPTSRLSTDASSNSTAQTLFSQAISSTQTPALSQTVPSTLYRLGLSQRKPKSKVPAFTTPFKPGMAPGEKGREMLDARNRATPSRVGTGLNGMLTPAKVTTPVGGKVDTNGRGISGITRALQAEKERQLLERAVFDTRRVPGRKSLRDAGVIPLPDGKKHSVTLELSIPYLNLKSASDFSFPQGGHAAALTMLHEQGCTLATKEWAKNHWGQIVWKLAGMARTSAEEAKRKWSWEEASEQMLYRYEREINRAERPAIRLVQERDASPAQAMVLCVSDIQFHDNDEVEIELTDGWYRIRTVSDKTLARAARKGKLVVGRKIGVAGAKLEGGNEGKEVLRAYHTSALKVGGNSTSLAPWDARLGFQPRPFIASLRSLTADGGSIALLDVQVLKLFPVGFVETDQTGRSSRPCDQSGEDEAQRAWEERHTNEASKWRMQFEKQLERMKAAASKLGYAARGVDPNPDASPPNEAEDFLEELEDSEFDIELLKSRRFSPVQAAWLATAVQAKCDELYERREEEMERDLASTCPPRKVRNFRVVVIKDAGTLRRPTGRTAQLTVWDVLSFGGDTLRVGQRYLLANVQPSQQGSWRKGNEAADIYLSTRRDTKWTVVSGA